MNATVGPIDCIVEQEMFLGSLNADAVTGETLRAMWILAKPILGDPSAYWVLTIFAWDGGKYTELRSLHMVNGFPGTPFRVSFDPEIRIERGETLVLRATPTGASVPLTGLGVIPEYGQISTRRTA